MRDQGIEAEATPRRARGVVRKPKTQAMKHMLREKRSVVFKAKIDEAIGELQGLASREQRPWERAIKERRREVRATYVEVAKDLHKAHDVGSRQAAAQLAEFLKGLPQLETERHWIKRELAPLLENERVREADQPAQSDSGKEY